MVTNSSQSVGDADGVTSASGVADVDGVAPMVVVGDIVPSASGGGAVHPTRRNTTTKTAAVGM
jgi:hypothetical protein